MTAGLFQQDGQIDGRTAHAAIFGRQAQPEPAVLGERVVGFARGLGVLVAFLRIWGRADFVEQLADVGAQRLLILREAEIHGAYLWSRLARSSTRLARWNMA